MPIRDCYHGVERGGYDNFLAALDERIENGVYDEETGLVLERARYIIGCALSELDEAIRWQNQFRELLVKLP